MNSEPAKALTIGGSDSGGAAGIQADLKTWTALGIYGMSAITAVTAQNSLTVAAVHYLSPEMVAAQITAVLTDYGAEAIKTGFLGQTALITEVARQLRRRPAIPLIVDPVLVNHQGQAMFAADVIAAYTTELLPLATVVTPNWREAALLAGLPPADLLSDSGLDTAVTHLHEAGAANVLVTGLLRGAQIVDVWSDGRDLVSLPQPRIDTANTHGSGDTLSAALCAWLARGTSLQQAIPAAQSYTARAIRDAAEWRVGSGHGPLSHFAPD
jgi:hydroxymethylpyrimidine/phosphomethylpyrimidine kinase